MITLFVVLLLASCAGTRWDYRTAIADREACEAKKSEIPTKAEYVGKTTYGPTAKGGVRVRYSFSIPYGGHDGGYEKRCSFECVTPEGVECELTGF
ncbi:hypothetical protein KJ632_00635 [Patescibacteria group bacterium]|nr:hypothetical protein [Patescibacteria group bacterium]